MKRIFRCFDLAALCKKGRHQSVLWSRYRGRDHSLATSRQVGPSHGCDGGEHEREEDSTC